MFSLMFASLIQGSGGASIASFIAGGTRSLLPSLFRAVPAVYLPY
jgi:hypothetical protein